MRPETDSGLNAWGIPLGYPTFDPEFLDTWFLQLEMSFQLSGVTKQRMMFRHATTALLSNVTSLIFDITGDAPEGICYDLFKRAIIYLM
nr:hypothetical transcript [Hymenolepis microstoma]